MARGGIEPPTNHFFAKIFRNLSVTHKKIDNSNHQADMVHYFFHLLTQYKDDKFLREIQKELRIREKQD